MHKDLIKTTCPQCGAQGTAGRYCEYCGTKIPEPEQIIEAKQEDVNTPFSWYNVVPVGYQISESDVVGDSKKSLFMVVKSRDEKRSKYGIINRQGKFVVDCNKESLTFFQESNYYYEGYEGHLLQNLVTGKTIVNGENYNVKAVWGTHLIAITDNVNEKFSLFDMKSERFIELPSELSDLNTEYEYCSMGCRFIENMLVFHKHETSGKIGEEDHEVKDTLWKVKIEDGKAEIIDCNVKIKDKKAERAAEAERRAAKKKAEKKAKKKYLLIMSIIMSPVLFIAWWIFDSSKDLISLFISLFIVGIYIFFLWFTSSTY